MIYFIIGIIIGAMLGILIMSCLVASNHSN